MFDGGDVPVIEIFEALFQLGY